MIDSMREREIATIEYRRREIASVEELARGWDRYAERHTRRGHHRAAANARADAASHRALAVRLSAAIADAK